MSKKYQSQIERFINSKSLPVDNKKQSWPDQFKNAVNVNNGDIENASFIDNILHSIFFPWKVIYKILNLTILKLLIKFMIKVLFSILPPPELLNGWPCYIVSMLFLVFLIFLVVSLLKFTNFLFNMDQTILYVK